MASQLLKRFSAARVSSVNLSTLASSSRTTRVLLRRSYAANPNASPGHSSNVSGNPVSANPEAKEVNESRATDSRANQDSASVARPVSNPDSTGLGSQEEPQPSQEHMKRDPQESPEKKRSEVLKEGQKPLDAADK